MKFSVSFSGDALEEKTFADMQSSLNTWILFNFVVQSVFLLGQDVANAFIIRFCVQYWICSTCGLQQTICMAAMIAGLNQGAVQRGKNSKLLQSCDVRAII